MNDFNNLTESDLYDLFNIEYSELIINIYDEVNEYCNSDYNDFYIKPKFSEFINLIYDNIDYKNSSNILNNIRKNDIKELEYEYNEINYDYLDDN